MKTFHGKQSIKDKYIKRLKEHQEADNIIQGEYWENGKGCAVGCTIEGSDHKRYETELGIPEWLAHLEDKIFEGLSNEEAKKFPLEFLEAIPVGVSENDIYRLRCNLDFYRLSNLLQNLEPEEFGVEKAIREIMRLNFEYTDIDDESWSAAESAARSAVRSARSAWLAARSAAESAAESAVRSAWLAAWLAARSAVRSARSAAESAARSAVRSAWLAAESARSAAESAARSAVRSAWLAAESAARSKEKENLIRELKKLKGNIEEESIKEMTLKEVCEKLGEDIKIIKE